ncbi:TolC family protein [Thiomonas sp. FB-6]|uniref:TolC family protein n=1 Tax=Thiomonas sp. FB-6 TaxID=1158291 RepID=UPI00037DAC9F|nr:TolC family protein [Thiomonas sp. FB-6]
MNSLQGLVLAAACLGVWPCATASATGAVEATGTPSAPQGASSPAAPSAAPSAAPGPSAWQQLAQPTLPRAGLLRALLAQAPSLAEARALRDAADARADALRIGPQEFTAQAQVQQRRVDEAPDNGRYTEWQLQLNRPLRLPSQAQADRQLAEANSAQARQLLSGSRREWLDQLLRAWFDAQLAGADARLARASAQALDRQAGMVQRRQQLGDASRLELDLVAAEQARADAAALLAEGRAASQRAALQARWPLLAADPALQGDPASAAMLREVPEDSEALRERMLDHSAVLAQARGAVRQAEAQAEQARAARTPQPTVGAYLGSDRGGRERIVGLQVQIPIGGAARAAGERAALADLEAARWRLQEQGMRVREQTRSLLAQGQAQAGAAQALMLAAQRQQAAAERTQRAWELGEVGASEWLLARRNALDVQMQALQARFDAARASALLRLHEGLLDPQPAPEPARP